MGLVEMYRTTGDRKCLEVAEIMIDNRGAKPGGEHTNGGTDQTQDRVPLRRESEAVGHAVTASCVALLFLLSICGIMRESVHWPVP
jgi:hypothetical protein